MAKTKTKDHAALACPCGSGQTYAKCCGLFHAGAAAPTPERLMRSRYSAFALRLFDYVADTWHPSSRPSVEELKRSPHPQWIGLTVKNETLLDADRATVEFVAVYRDNGRAQKMQELSRFVREDGRWYYLDGVLPDQVPG